MRHHSPPRCACCWFWPSLWDWLWQLETVLKPSPNAHLLEKNEVWVIPPPEAEVKRGRAWPGLKGVRAAWGHHGTSVNEKRCGLVQSPRDPCVHSNVRERMWTMRHMD